MLYFFVSAALMYSVIFRMTMKKNAVHFLRALMVTDIVVVEHCGADPGFAKEGGGELWRTYSGGPGAGPETKPLIGVRSEAS